MDHMKGHASRRVDEAKAAHEIRSYKENLHGNILAGPHVVPGLASRCILEISRIEAQGGHEDLVNEMTTMPGEKLVSRLLKDFLRPQVMLPWSVSH